MSDKKHLLVEGTDDYNLFQFLIREFYPANHSFGNIDNAEHLVEFDSKLGNREKVEYICRSIENTDYSFKFIGFVDRESREFNTDGVIRDHISGHNVLGRLVWSRGHSVENYFFDIEILRETLRVFSSASEIGDIINLFESNFELVIRVACCASLASSNFITDKPIGNSIQALPDLPG